MTTTSFPAAQPTSSRRENLAVGCAAALFIAGDYLFWKTDPGVSIGVFALLIAVALFVRHRPPVGRNAVIASALLTACAGQTFIELSFTNFICIVSLIVVLFGESAFHALRHAALRWAEAIWALCRPITSWAWVPALIRRIPAERRVLRDTLETLLRVVLPAAVLGCVFAMLLSAGNAVVGRWIADAFGAFFSWFTSIDLFFGRLILWLLLGTLALTLMRPREIPAGPRIWARDIPDFPAPAKPSIARWRSVVVLALLNALFFAANTADAIYLWTKAELPSGVSYSEFVHDGVYSLIAAVILSALLLVLIFQQAETIRTAPAVKALALFWIAQNVVLISGVLLRLQRYVEAYQLSELRVYVGCFLLLVTAGFVLLTIHVVARKGLTWLVLTNVAATFTLFFVLQFPDVARWVAESNVARWQNDPKRTLDVEYLSSLGASAIPSLIRVADTGRPEAHDAFLVLQKRKPAAERRLADRDWRSWQQREIRNLRLLAPHEVRMDR